MGVNVTGEEAAVAAVRDRRTGHTGAKSVEKKVVFRWNYRSQGLTPRTASLVSV